MSEPLSKKAKKQKQLKRKRENNDEGEEREKKIPHTDDEIIECKYCGYLIWWNDEYINCGCECPECGEHPYDCECVEYEQGIMISRNAEDTAIRIDLVKKETKK